MRQIIYTFIVLILTVQLKAQINPQLTHTPPALLCVKNETSNQISIQWNAPSDIGNCFLEYGVYIVANDKDGTYQKIASISNPSSGSLTIDPKTNGIVYVFMLNEQSCPDPNITEIFTSDTLNNIVPQPAPTVRKITVENDVPVIYWEPSKNPEVTSYAIFSLENGYNTAIDTVNGRNSFYFQNPMHNASDSVAVYKIRSIEYCEDPKGLYSNITAAYNTIKLTHGEENICKRSVLLEWNGYNNITPVLGYRIDYSMDNGSTYQTKDTLEATARSYEFLNLAVQEMTTIRVVALLANHEESWSNVVKVIGKGVAPPRHHYIRNVTVKDDYVELEYVPDLLAEVSEIALERSTTGENYSVLSSGVSIDPPTGSQPYIIKDYSALTSRSSLYYKVSIKNSCSNKYSTFPAKTILLKGANQAFNNDLEWNQAEIDEDLILNYELKRISDGDTITIYNSSDAGKFVDQNIFTGNSFEDICYLVQAEHISNDTTRSDGPFVSSSNAICLHPTPKAIVPNAFAPDGHNKVFKPILVFSSEENYSLKIFNRYGEKIFESSQPNIGWDGTHDTENGSLDSYLYHLEFTGLDGVAYKRSGFVVLVR